MGLYSKITLFFLGLIFVLIVSEVLLRIFWNPPYLDKKYVRNDLDWISKNIRLNKFGYRDREFDFEKPKGVRRVYALGDSYTYGWMIEDASAAYPKVLEEMLKPKFAESFEVINASRAGFNFFESLNRLEQEGILFSPDLVMVGLNVFDLLPREYVYAYPNTFPYNLKIYQLTLGNFGRLTAARNMDKEIKSTYSEGSSQIEKARERIREVKKILGEFKPPLVLVVFPDYDPANPNLGVRYQIFEDALKKFGEEEGVKIVALSKYFEAVDNKTELVLNPVDPHPTALANRLAAEAVFEEIDFEDIVLRPGAPVSAKPRVIMKIETPGWVYFDRKYQDNVQKLPVPNTADRKIPYLEDILKTARMGRHAGWPGAKIEYNIPLNGELEFWVKDEIYGFKIVGVGQVTIFWREEGALHSSDLTLDKLGIKREEDKIKFKINSGSEKSLDLARVVFDVSVNQFDIDGLKTVSVGRTEIVGLDFLDVGQVASKPSYFWCDDQLVLVGGYCNSNSKMEIPVMIERSFDNDDLPVVKYLY